MRIILSIFFVSVLGISSRAQDQLIVENESGLPIPGAKVLCISLDLSDTIRSVTDINGFVSVCKKGTITVSASGFLSFSGAIGDTNSLKKVVLLQSNELDAVCVTAQYAPTTANDAIHKITVISAEKIEQSGANNLSDILTYQAGIRLSQDNILGSSMDLSGLSGENVKILIDGVPVIGRQNGNIDLSQINLNNVEKIEIVEGPLSVNYGSNALAGTINIITKKALPNGLNIEVNPYYESIGNYNFNLTGGVKIKSHTFSVSAGRNYFDGWSASDDFLEFPKARLADTNRFKAWKPKEQYFGEARYTTSVSGWTISPYARYFDELITNRGWPTPPYYEQAFDDFYATQRTDFGGSFNKKFKASSIKGLVAYNMFDRIKNTYYTDLTTLQKTLSETEGAQDTSVFNLFNTRVSFQSLTDRKLNYQLGFDLNLESATGRRIEGQSQQINDYAVFATAEWKPMESLIVRPGLRYAYNTVYPAPVIPSLNVRFRHKKITFRGSVARGFRSPTLKELYFDFVDINHNITGNTDLLSEYSWNYSANIDWMRQTLGNNFIKLSYGAYYNDITNLITLGVTNIEDNAFTYLNLGTFKTIGNQFTVLFRTKQFNVNLNGAYIGRYNIDSDITSVPVYSFSPDLSANVTWKLFDGFALNVFYKYNGRLQNYYVNEDKSVQVSTQSDYSILDMSMTIKILKQKQLQFTIGAKNLLNVRQINVVGQVQGTTHSSSSGFNVGRGLSVFVSAKYKINYSFGNEVK